jgi:hypothetical protein
MEVGSHVPIAADYSQLREFFIKFVDVNTVTPAFMMRELATAAQSRSKTIDSIKSLMLAVSGVLSHDSKASEFWTSIETLEQCKYLPCRCFGTKEFQSKSQVFFIVDNESYANDFEEQLIVLDFTYQELNSLHNVIKLLGLDDHYLTWHVDTETTTGGAEEHQSLTAQFRECAYPLSW